MLLFDQEKVRRSDDNNTTFFDAALIKYWKRNFETDVPYWGFIK